MNLMFCPALLPKPLCPFHLKLQRERLKKRMTIEDLAEVLKVDAAKLSFVEQGVEVPDRELTIALENFFLTTFSDGPSVP